MRGAISGSRSRRTRPGTAQTGLADLWHPSFRLAVAAIAASHLYSFATNYLGRGEYARANLMPLMQRPYGRIVVMHVTILLGAGLLMVLGSPPPMLLVLIGGKIALDLKLHLGERRKLGSAVIASAIMSKQPGPSFGTDVSQFKVSALAPT